MDEQRLEASLTGKKGPNKMGSVSDPEVVVSEEKEPGVKESWLWSQSRGKNIQSFLIPLSFAWKGSLPQALGKAT